MELNLNRNMMIGIGAGVVGILAAIAAFLLYGEISRFNTAKEDLNGSKGRLKRYYQGNPFPSPDNVAKEKDNVKTLNEWSGKMLSGLRKGEIPLEEKVPAILLKQLGDTQDALRQIAPAKFPTDFRFGFERYKDWIPPLATEVKQLLEQIVVIETITKLLLEEEVTAIQSIVREEFEGKTAAGSAAGAAMPVNSVPDQFQRKTAQGKPTAPAAGKLDISRNLYEKSKYVFEFTAKEPNLLRILNRLGRHGVFLVVTSVQIDASSSDIRPAPKQDSRPAAAVAGEPVVAPATTNQADGAAAVTYVDRRDRVVSGDSFSAPMKIKLVLDAYRFKEAVAP